MSNWETLPLGDVLTFQRGFDITKAEQRDGPYWVISSSGPKSKNESYKVAGPGVVIGRKGSLGTVFYSHENYWPHDTTLWVKDFHENDPKFAYYYLQTMGLERLDAGSSNPSLNRNHIHTIPVLWPIPVIQRRIAGILSAYDDLIENSQRRIKILEEMARRLYREWFVHFRFPGHEGCMLVESPLGVIPEGWEVRALGEVLELNYGKALKKEDRQEGVYPVFGSSGQVGTHDTSLTTGPGIIVGRKGNVGSVFWCDKDFFVIDTAYYVTSSLPLRYLYYVLPTLNFINSDAAVPGLSRAQAYGLLFFVPPGSLIQEFCNYAEAFEGQANVLRDTVENLRRTRDLLLPRLLSGQIDVEALPEPALTEP
jgi:type I restriction enzyme S subunit